MTLFDSLLVRQPKREGKQMIRAPANRKERENIWYTRPPTEKSGKTPRLEAFFTLNVVKFYEKISYCMGLYASEAEVETNECLSLDDKSEGSGNETILILSNKSFLFPHSFTDILWKYLWRRYVTIGGFFLPWYCVTVTLSHNVSIKS